MRGGRGSERGCPENCRSDPRASAALTSYRRASCSCFTPRTEEIADLFSAPAVFAHPGGNGSCLFKHPLHEPFSEAFFVYLFPGRQFLWRSPCLCHLWASSRRNPYDICCQQHIRRWSRTCGAGRRACALARQVDARNATWRLALARRRGRRSSLRLAPRLMLCICRGMPESAAIESCFHVLRGVLCTRPAQSTPPHEEQRGFSGDLSMARGYFHYDQLYT